MIKKIKGIKNFFRTKIFLFFKILSKKQLTRQLLCDKIGLISMVFVGDHWRNGKIWIFRSPKIVIKMQFSKTVSRKIPAFARVLPPTQANVFPL